MSGRDISKLDVNIADQGARSMDKGCSACLPLTCTSRSGLKSVRKRWSETTTPSVRFIDPFTVCSVDPIVVLPFNQVGSLHRIVRYSSIPFSVVCGVA